MDQIDYAIARALTDGYVTMSHYTRPQECVQEDRCRKYILKSERVDRRMRIRFIIKSSTPTEIWTSHEFRDVTDVSIEYGDNLTPKALVISEDQARYEISINIRPSERPLFHHPEHIKCPPANDRCPTDSPDHPVRPPTGHGHHRPSNKPSHRPGHDGKPLLPEHGQRPEHGHGHGHHHHHKPQLGPVEPLPGDDFDSGFNVMPEGPQVNPLPGLDSGFTVDPETQCGCPHDGTIEEHSGCCGLPPYDCPECAGQDNVNSTTFRRPSDRA